MCIVDVESRLADEQALGQLNCRQIRCLVV